MQKLNLNLYIYYVEKLGKTQLDLDSIAFKQTIPNNCLQNIWLFINLINLN